MLFKYFREFRPEPTKIKPSSWKVLFTVNWLGGTCDSPNQIFYELLKNNYDGTLPQWHTVNTKKNDIHDLSIQQEQFNKDLEAFIAEKRSLNSQRKAI